MELVSLLVDMCVSSIGVSVKMSILLYAPGLLLIMLAHKGLAKTITLLSVCATVQVSETK